MADALKLLIGGPSTVYVVLFGTGSVVATVFMNYDRYVTVLKWMTLVLFAYVATLFATHIPGRRPFSAFWYPISLGVLRS